ncbi:class I SAM-dependent methyltransferase [Candidatus Woesearchaeota archaeon]|nr:class I SAM-dependent methyltransferase [Candidatus Woesearchaeota archaeon]
MDDYYNSISEGYEELYLEEQRKKLDIILSELPKYFSIKPEHTLLDVGCGTGITTQPWKCKRTGLDPAKKLLEKAHNKEEIKYVLGKAESIPFENDSFDIVVSITAIQNFADTRKGLLEIKRVGKDFFILSFLKKSSKANKIEETINEYFKVLGRVEEEKDILFFCNK